MSAAAASHLRVTSSEHAVAADSGLATVAADYQPYEQSPLQALPTHRTRRRVSIPAVTLCALCFFVLGLGLVAQKATLMARTYHLAQLRSDLAELEREQGYLQLAAMNARSLQSIERQARERLGMVEPSKVEFLVLEQSASQNRFVQEQAGGADEGPKMTATMGKWLNENWPLWGKAEARRRQ